MKCEKCHEADATVYYAIISGKFKATRKRYCRPCMEQERIRLKAPVTQQNPTQQNVFSMVQDTLAKQESKAAVAEQHDNTPAKKVSRLKRQMNMAIGEERYEDAARIRDEITKIEGADVPQSKSSAGKSALPKAKGHKPSVKPTVKPPNEPEAPVT